MLKAASKWHLDENQIPPIHNHVSGSSLIVTSLCVYGLGCDDTKVDFTIIELM